MTKRELIEALREVPDDAELYIFDGDYGRSCYEKLDSVKLIQARLGCQFSNGRIHHEEELRCESDLPNDLRKIKPIWTLNT